MEKVEMVRVRSTPEAVCDAMSSITECLENMRTTTSASDIKIFRLSRYEGDLAVFIFWDHSTTREKSREGLMVAEILQQIGAFNHFVWVTK